MADIFSKKKRSEIMKKIGPKNSAAEKYIRDIIAELKYNFSSHIHELPGTPDFVFKRKQKAIFINGCFWHGHKGCKRAKLPTTHRVFWKEKIKLNISTDRKTHRKLNKLGWNYLVIWQCQIKDSERTTLKNRIRKFLQ